MDDINYEERKIAMINRLETDVQLVMELPFGNRHIVQGLKYSVEGNRDYVIYFSKLSEVAERMVITEKWHSSTFKEVGT